MLISPLTVNSWSRLQLVVIQTQHTPHYCSSKSRPITRKMAVISRTLHPNKPPPPGTTLTGSPTYVTLQAVQTFRFHENPAFSLLRCTSIFEVMSASGTAEACLSFGSLCNLALIARHEDPYVPLCVLLPPGKRITVTWR